MRMFSDPAPPKKHYNSNEHLAETAEVISSFPRTGLQVEKGDPDIAEVV